MKESFTQQFLYSTAFMAALTGYNDASDAHLMSGQNGVSTTADTPISQTLQLPLHTTNNPIQRVDSTYEINLNELQVSMLSENFWGYPLYKIILALLDGAEFFSRTPLSSADDAHPSIDYKNGILRFHTLPTKNFLEKEPSQKSALELLIQYTKTDVLKTHIVNSFIREQNLKELKRLGRLGWTAAQEFYAVGLAKGKYGIEQNHEELKRLALQDKHKNESPYVENYIKSCLKTPLEILEFFLEITLTDDDKSNSDTDDDYQSAKTPKSQTRLNGAPAARSS